jgi:hypothetical protein
MDEAVNQFLIIGRYALAVCHVQMRRSLVEQMLFQKTYGRILALADNGDLFVFKTDGVTCTLKWKGRVRDYQSTSRHVIVTSLHCYIVAPLSYIVTELYREISLLVLSRFASLLDTELHIFYDSVRLMCPTVPSEPTILVQPYFRVTELL